MTDIIICVGSSCHIKGAKLVVKRLDELIKEKKLEAEIKISGSFCMGECINEGVSVKVNGKIFFVKPGEEDIFFNEHILSEASE